SPRVRNLILAGLASGDIEVVTNVDVLSEGWDLPSLGAVIMARPTESLSKYLQMAGRVQRPYEGRVPIVIDHASNVLRHGLPCRDIEWSLRGGRERSGVPVMKACVSCSFALPGGCATCPECGAEQPIAPPTPREEKQEIPATLAEVSPTRMDEIIARVNALAAVKGAPDGWADKVVADLAR
ncbi:MAG TPA: helicase-related protein, partial [Planctomycetota bacterium]|nr:helicase-related protein [Planctomycetota bacterium]